MSFPKNSAFHDDPRTPEDIRGDVRANQDRRVQEREAALRKEARLPINELEDIIYELREIPWRLSLNDPTLEDAVEAQVLRLTSYLPG